MLYFLVLFGGIVCLPPLISQTPIGNIGWEYYDADDPLCETGQWHEIWREEFDGNALDPHLWRTHYPCPDGSDDCERARLHTDESATIILDENVEVSGGLCRIRTKKELVSVDWQNQNGTSGTHVREVSSGSVQMRDYPAPFTSGRLEMRAKISHTDYGYASFWLYGIGGGQTYHEIDIFEIDCKDREKIPMALHNNSNGEKKGYQSFYQSGIDLSADWHTYSLEWEANFVRWFLDGQMINEVPRLQLPGFDACGLNKNYGCTAPSDVYQRYELFPRTGFP